MSIPIRRDRISEATPIPASASPTPRAAPATIRIAANPHDTARMNRIGAPMAPSSANWSANSAMTSVSPASTATVTSPWLASAITDSAARASPRTACSCDSTAPGKTAIMSGRDRAERTP